MNVSLTFAITVRIWRGPKHIIVFIVAISSDGSGKNKRRKDKSESKTVLDSSADISFFFSSFSYTTYNSASKIHFVHKKRMLAFCDRHAKMKNVNSVELSIENSLTAGRAPSAVKKKVVHPWKWYCLISYSTFSLNHHKKSTALKSSKFSLRIDLLKGKLIPSLKRIVMGSFESDRRSLKSVHAQELLLLSIDIRLSTITREKSDHKSVK